VTHPESLGQVLGDEVVPCPESTGKHVPQEGLDKGGPSVAAAGSGVGSQRRSGGRKFEAGVRRDSIYSQFNSIEPVKSGDKIPDPLVVPQALVWCRRRIRIAIG
jgi:hypothetical protein